MISARVLQINRPADAAITTFQTSFAAELSEGTARELVFRTIKLAGADREALDWVAQLGEQTGVTVHRRRDAREGEAVLAGSLEQFDRLTAALAATDGLSEVASAIRDAIDRYGRRPVTVEARGHRFDFGSRVYVMGILNRTIDSAYDHGRYFDLPAAIARGLEMVEDGADIVEVGGQSAQPRAERISEQEEIDRVVPVIESLASRGIAVAVDTYRAGVVRAALEAGAVLVNDIGGLVETEIAGAAADAGAMLVIMHIRNRPKVDFHQPEHNWTLEYRSVVDEVVAFLRERTEQAIGQGMARERIVLDPGLGFDKIYRHDLEIMHRFGELRSLGQPLLLATSHKNYIGELLDRPPDDDLQAGTAAAVAWGVGQGANIIRVHDVRFMAEVAKLTEYLARLRPLPPHETVRMWK